MDFDASTAEPVAAVAEPAFDPESASPVAQKEVSVATLPEEDRKRLEELGINRGQGFEGARSDAKASGGSFQQKFVEPAAQEALAPAVKLPEADEALKLSPSLNNPVGRGLYRAVKGPIESLTAPVGAVLAPLPGGGPGGRILAGGAATIFTAEMAKEIPDQVKNAIKVIQDPKASIEDKITAVATPGVQSAMTALGAGAAYHEAASLRPTPKFSDHPVTFEAQTPDGKTIQVETTAGKLAEMVKADETPAKPVEAPKPAEPAFDPTTAKPLAAEEPFVAETAKAVVPEASPKPEVKINIQQPDPHPTTGEPIPAYAQVVEKTNDGLGEPMTPEQRAAYPTDAEILDSGLPTGEYTLEQVNAAIEKKANEPPPYNDFGSPESDTYGIANRVNEARAKSGDIAPVETGTSPGPEALIARGRELLKEGETPDEAFIRAHTIKDAGERTAFVRAYGEQLFKKASDAAEKFGTDSPEYKAAAKADSEWVQRIQPFKTELARGFHALQGETEIDTGTFHGIRRAFQDLSGRDFTPKEETVAKEYVDKQQAAQKAVEDFQPEFKKAINEVVAPARKAVGAKILSSLKERSDAALARLKAKQGRLSAGIDPTDLRDYAEIAAYHIARGVDAAAELIKQFGESIREHIPAILDAAKKTYSDATKGELGNTVAGVYQRAKDYLDKGETNPSDVVAKIAADLGTTQADIWEKLATNKTVRTVTDEMFRRQAARRQLTDAARNWVQERSAPLAYRVATAPFRAGFKIATFGHGTVAPFTHAPLLGFNAPTFGIFWRNWAKGFKLMGIRDAGAFHERVMQDLVRDPNYITFRRAGLNNEPHRAATDYERAWMGGWLERIGAIGNRGFDSLKLIRQDYANQLWDKTPESQRTPLMAKMYADEINHATGSVSRSYGPITRAIFFAPRLIASQFSHLVLDSGKAAIAIAKGTKATPEERTAAIAHVKFLASAVGAYAAALALNQGLLSASGSKQKINFSDPHQADWLKFKAIGLNIAPVSGPLALVRLLGNLIRIEAGQLEGMEKRSGKGGALKDTALDFARSKLSPTMGVLTDVATGTDFQGRPLPFSSQKVPSYLRKEGVGKYSYAEYGMTHMTMIPVAEASREIWKHQGMDESTAEHLIKALLMGVEAGAVGARVTPDYKVEAKK